MWDRKCVSSVSGYRSGDKTLVGIPICGISDMQIYNSFQKFLELTIILNGEPDENILYFTTKSSSTIEKSRRKNKNDKIQYMCMLEISWTAFYILIITPSIFDKTI